jgi:ATP synthase F0 subunit b
MIFNSLAVHAAEQTEGGRTGLGLNLIDIGFYLICFVIAMVILNNFLFKPLAKILDERAKRIDSDFDKMEEMETKITNAENQAKSILAQAYSDSRGIIEEAKSQVESVKSQIILDAENQRDEIIQKANKEGEKIIINSKLTAEKDILVLVQKTIQKATSNLKISGSAQNEILGSIINTKL